jgi:hypothetical protein
MGNGASLTGQQAFALLFFVVLFGIIGFKWGTKKSLLYAFAIFLGEVMVSSEAMAQKVIAYLNGMYMGVMLALKGGLAPLGRGDVETARKIVAGVHPPFSLDATTILVIWALLLAIALGLGSLKMFQGKPSIWGAILGGAMGYAIGLLVLPLPENMPMYPWEIKLQGVGQATKDLGIPSSSIKTLILVFILITIVSAGLSLSPSRKK